MVNFGNLPQGGGLITTDQILCHRGKNSIGKNQLHFERYLSFEKGLTLDWGKIIIGKSVFQYLALLILQWLENIGVEETAVLKKSFKLSVF